MAADGDAQPADGRHATIVDVARVANVAPSTASRALSESPRISDSTKRRVRAAARSLGYQPNRIAQSLRLRSGNFVGIVVPDIGVDFYSRFVKGAQDVLQNAGRQVLVLNTEREAGRETAALKTLGEHRVSGILIATSGGGSASQPRVPTVFFDNLAPGRGVAHVACANRDGVGVLVDHLAGHGHTRIAYIGGPPTLTSGRERLDGFLQAMQRLGLDADAVELADAAWSPGSAAAAMGRLLALERPPTAVVTSGDTLVLGAMSACRAAGLRLPEDVALASFDDPAFGDLLDPPVTALARSDAAMGKLAASLLLHALDTETLGPPTEVRLPVELVVRRSCGCP
jgi:DNA-binding LacI/PurR family transcriptional regulator